MRINCTRYILAFFFSVTLFQKTFAQVEVLAPIRQKLDDFNKHLLTEKIYVHTDKEFYTAGDILWLKLYVVDGFTQQALNASKVGYVELLDQNNTAAARVKIELTKKGGDGSIQLPLNLNSGHYTLRAYTNWMKNFGAERFFEKRITVVNPLKNLNVKDENKASEYSLSVFPEGGNLVTGLPSKLAFKLSDKYGTGIGGKGFLLNEKNDTLLRFVPFKFGMGSFDFVPQAGHSYKTVFLLNDGSFVTMPLPTIYEKGYVMRVTETDNNRLKIMVWSNVQSGYPEVFLVGQNSQQIRSMQRNVLSDGVATFYVNKADLGAGVSMLTIFNNEKQPVCERLFFIQPINKPVNIETSKKQFSSREKVSINIDESTAANVSVSVFQVDPLQKSDGGDIVSSMWLSSEVKGFIEQPGYYFSSNTEEVLQAADNLMLTQGWRRFNWETVLNAKPVIKFSMEKSGHIITGRVIDTRTKTIAKDIPAFLSVPVTKYKLFTSRSDNAGLVRFNVPDYYGYGDIIAQTNTQRDSFYKVEVLSPFFESYTSHSYAPLSLNENVQPVLTSYSVGMQTQHIYTSDSINQFALPKLNDTFSFYGRPLYTYKLDDYTRFTTMEEVLREYVREINVGVKGSGTNMRFKLFNEDDRELYTEDILVMIDGVPFFNPGKVFSFDPLKIKTLDIITKNYILGYSRFHGLANFNSYQGNFEGFEPDDKALMVDYEGLQLHREFYSPDYSSEAMLKSRIPDFRTTLFWSPNVNTKKIEFYTGDNKGNYIIVLQGIDANGNFISTTSNFEVR